MDESTLHRILTEFARTSTPARRAEFLAQHAALLLSDDAHEAISATLERYRGAQDAEAVGVFENLIRLVELCREQGVETGLAVYRDESRRGWLLDFLSERSWGERRRLLELDGTPLLEDEVFDAIAELRDIHAGNREALAEIELVTQVISDVREHGVVETMAGIRTLMLSELGAAAHDLRREDADARIAQLRDLATKDEWADTNVGVVEAILGAERRGAAAWASDEIRRGVDGSPSSMCRVETQVRGAFQLLGVGGDETDQASELAIGHLEEALASSTDLEAHVSGLRRSLARAYQRRRIGDERQNLERAEELLEGELADANVNDDRPLRRSLEVDLGVTKARLGEREAAVRLLVDRPGAGPAGSSAEIDDVLLLANLLTETDGPGRGNAIDAAIDVLTMVARRLVKASLEWGRIQIALSDAWRIRLRGTRFDNSEHAIAAAHAAETAFTREERPDEWAQLQHNLGAIYYGRVGGDTAYDLEKAIACYQRALTVHTRDAFPSYFGLSSSSLGLAFVKRIEGDRYDNNKRAEKHLRDAEDTLDREMQPKWWAESQTGLAEVYRQRLGPNRQENLETAAEHLEEARRTYEAIGDSQRASESLSNLAALYIDLGDLDSRFYAEALRSVEAALAMVDQAMDPYHWAVYQRNLAAVLSRSDGLDLDGASTIAALESALEVFTPDAYLREHEETQAMIGHVHFEAGDWGNALSAYEAAISAGDLVLATTYTEAGREYAIARTQLTHSRAAWCLLQADNAGRALEVLEAGKTRRLREALSLAKYDISRVEPGLATRLAEAAASVRTLEAQMRSSPGGADRFTSLAEDLRNERATLTAIVEEIRLGDPRFLRASLSAEEIVALIPEGGALVAFLVTTQGSAGFVIESGATSVRQHHIQEISDFTHDELDAMLDPEVPESWLSLLSIAGSSTGAEHRGNSIRNLTLAVGERLMEPVRQRMIELGVAPGASVLLLPHAGLGLLPLHAGAWLEAGELRYFCDDYVVTYAPSAYWHWACIEGMHTADAPSTWLAVIDPSGDLRYAAAEGSALTDSFESVRLLVGPEATRSAVVAAARDAGNLHFACHGAYDWSDAMASELQLAHADVITVADVLSGALALESTRFVALSACETGLTEFSISPDEYIGLPAAFTVAGAGGVLASLWSVGDAATYLLMQAFYREYPARSPASALWAAQRWLRSVTAIELALLKPHGAAILTSLTVGSRHRWSEEEPIFSDPFYWAGFTYTGA